MDRIKIYIETEIHGPVRRNAAYGYVMEYIRPDGKPETREEFKNCTDVTENRLTIMALASALKRMRRKCSIRVFTGCSVVSGAFTNGWLEEWEKRNWKNAKGASVSNADAWQQLYEASKGQEIIFAGKEEPNSYKNWLQEEIKRRKDGEEKKHYN